LQMQTQEMKIQADELKNRQVQVEEADRLKSEFLSNMSHELRTPLNSVLVLSRIMLSRGTGKKPEEDAQYLEVIERNGRNLLGLINDILDLSKIESGNMEAVLSEFDPSEPVEDAVKTIQSLAESKGLDIGCNIEDVSLIYSDKDRVRQVLLNLLSNAVKFTCKGEINLTVSVSDEQISFVVRDTGIGISEFDLPHIFKEFRQADGSTTRQYGGTGLGLAISQRIARLLGGEIHVQSQVDKGSTFTLVLPLEHKDRKKSKEKTIHMPAKREEHDFMKHANIRQLVQKDNLNREQIIDCVRNLVKENQIKEKRPEAISEHLPLKSDISGHTEKNKIILVVEDNPDNLLSILTILKVTEYGCITAGDGEEAVRMAKEYHPGLILMDIQLPVLSGIDAAKQIKSDETLAEIPIIALTAKAMKGDQENILSAGCDDYIAKPLDPDILVERIKKWMG